jgi:hypothetical protein
MIVIVSNKKGERMRKAWFFHERGPRMGHKFGRGMGREDMMGAWRGGGRARRGDIKFLILEVLAEGPRHGYDIIVELENKSNGRYRPSPGSVYPRSRCSKRAATSPAIPPKANGSSRSPNAVANCWRRSRPVLRPPTTRTGSIYAVQR